MTAVTIAPKPPRYPGDRVTISVTVAEPAQTDDQFVMDGDIRQAWSDVASWEWAPRVKDLGAHYLEVQIRHPAGQVSYEDSFYIRHRAVAPPDDAPQTRR